MPSDVVVVVVVIVVVVVNDAVVKSAMEGPMCLSVSQIFALARMILSVRQLAS